MAKTPNRKGKAPNPIEIQRLTDATQSHLIQYLEDIRRCKNETAKRETFAALLGRLFSGAVVGKVTSGAEHSVRVKVDGRTRRGRIDTFHGNAVIEFENSLRRSGATARKQLKEYSAGVWSQQGPPFSPLVAIASDGVEWEVYRPIVGKLQTRSPSTEDVDLGDAVQKFTVTRQTISEFYFWLQALLFRPQQTTPTAELFQFDFGERSPLYAEAKDELKAAWHVVGRHKRGQTAFDTWQRYLRYTYAYEGGASGLEHLFLRHTYLASLARLLAWVALSNGAGRKGDVAKTIKSVLSGEWFRSRGLANVVDDDFFGWVLQDEAVAKLAALWERVLSTLWTYNLEQLSQDVLKDVYEQLVNPEERHALGEYYTPDWLCERVASEVLPTDRIASVLDPACGSGSFLRAAIAHYREHLKDASSAKGIRNILESVVGIDVHPLAVTVARVTYILAMRDLLDRPGKDVQIPVYLADALFIPSEVTEGELYGGQVTEGYVIRFGPGLSRSVAVPKTLVEAPRWFDPAIEACSDIARELAAGSKETRQSLESYIKRSLPNLSSHEDAEQMLGSLWEFTEGLADLIRREEDHIWAFIVRNAYRPAMLRHHFEFILGNPPWLSYRFIKDSEYQEEVRKRTVTQYKLAPLDERGRLKRALITQMELATVFLAHAIAQFGADDATLAFVMPRAVLTGDQHERLRSRSYNARKAPFTITSFWDLSKISPLFNVPSCVLFARRRSPKWQAAGYTLPAVEWTGDLPKRNVPWDDAEQHLNARKRKGRLIYLGNRNALSTTAGSPIPTKPSIYRKSFNQGATLVPRNMYFIDVPDLDGKPRPDGVYRAYTNEHQARLSKAPWRDMRMDGRIEGRFLFAVPLSREVLPFVMLQPNIVFLPYERRGDSAQMLTVDQLKRNGWRHAAKWMMNVSKDWEAKRPNGAKDMTAQDRLDYHRTLTCQTYGDSEWIVLYNHSGTNVSACYVRGGGGPLPLVMDAKVYYAVLKDESEAAYLTSILNSQTVNLAIKPFQSTGQQGERDVHTKPLELPIPRFDSSKALHKELANLGKQAAGQVSDVARLPDFPDTLARRRAFVRRELRELLSEIDKRTVPLLGLDASLR